MNFHNCVSLALIRVKNTLSEASASRWEIHWERFSFGALLKRHLIDKCQSGPTEIWAFQMILCSSRRATLRPRAFHERSCPNHHVTTTGYILLKAMHNCPWRSERLVLSPDIISWDLRNITANLVNLHPLDVGSAYRSDTKWKTRMIRTNLDPPLTSDTGLILQ